MSTKSLGRIKSPIDTTDIEKKKKVSDKNCQQERILAINQDLNKRNRFVYTPILRDTNKPTTVTDELGETVVLSIKQILSAK